MVVHSVVGCLRHEFGVERVQRASRAGAQEQAAGAGGTAGRAQECSSGAAADQRRAAGAREAATSAERL